ncbi:MAG TPA: DUF4097 family beta strand repeat-containing protein [Gemmatimonadaceae bacterium]
MSRPIFLLAAALAMTVPAVARAQSTSAADTAEQARERQQEERDRARERAQEARDQAREQAQELRDQARERAQELRERERERAQERAEREREKMEERRERERETAGALDTTVTFDARGSVNIACPGGDVKVTGTDRNQIVVHARSERGGIRFTSNGNSARLEPANGRDCNDAVFQVSVPAGVRLTAGTWSGSLSVRGVSGEIEGHAQSGDIEVFDAGDRLELETLSGDITVKGVRGDATIHTLSGSVTLDRAASGVEVETVSGDIELGTIASRQVRTNSTSGDLTFAGPIVDGGRYEFQTHSGGIRLELPANVGAQLSLSTFSGEIESAFPITLIAGEHGIGAAQAKKMNFSLGKGTARIIAETFSGDVTLSSTARPK